MTPRLWLWCAPLPPEVAAALDARRLEAEGALEEAAGGGESLVVADPEAIVGLIAAALGARAEALQLEKGRGASLVLSSRGWELERLGVVSTGPHLAAER